MVASQDLSYQMFFAILNENIEYRHLTNMWEEASWPLKAEGLLSQFFKMVPILDTQIFVLVYRDYQENDSNGWYNDFHLHFLS